MYNFHCAILPFRVPDKLYMVNGKLYMPLVFHQLAVSWALDFVSTETRSLVDFVVGVRTFEEEYLSIALESKDVGTDTVKEPTVV